MSTKNSEYWLVMFCLFRADKLVNPCFSVKANTTLPRLYQRKQKIAQAKIRHALVPSPPLNRYDARLFNQSAGMDSGFGAEDSYGVYSKPMFNRGEAQSVYRPKTDDGDAWGDADQQVCLLLFFRSFIFLFFCFSFSLFYFSVFLFSIFSFLFSFFLFSFAFYLFLFIFLFLFFLFVSSPNLFFS